MMVRKAAGLNWSINLDSWAAEDFEDIKFWVLQNGGGRRKLKNVFF